MWYVYYNVEQSDSDVQNDNATSAVTFGTVVYAATNFTGLVRFNGTNAVEDGSGNGLSFGSTGTTTIDGGRITTGTVGAQFISLTGKNVSELNNDSGYLTSHQSLSAYITTSAANNAFATINALNAKQDASTALTTDQTAGGTNLTNFQGVANASGIAFEATLTEQLATDLNTEAGGGTLTGDNLAKFKSAFTAAGLNLETVLYDPGTTTINSTFKGQLTSAQLALTTQVPFATATTSVAAGRIVLENNNLSLEQGTGSPTTSNSIVLEATNNQNRIVIYDGNVARVIIGKLGT